MSKIYSHKGVMAELSEVFKVSNVACWYALNWKRNSLNDRRIRSYAVNTLECYYRLSTSNIFQTT